MPDAGDSAASGSDNNALLSVEEALSLAKRMKELGVASFQYGGLAVQFVNLEERAARVGFACGDPEPVDYGYEDRERKGGDAA